MKRTFSHLGLLSLGIACIDISRAAESTHQQVFVNRFVIDETFPWIKEGRIIYYRVEGGLAPHGALSFYHPKGNREIIALNGSLAALSDVVRHEEVVISEKFLARQLPLFLVFLTAQPRNRLLNREYDAEIQQSRSLKPEMKNSIAQLCRDPQLVVERTFWSLSFPVVNADGSACDWTVEGRSNPFSIVKISIKGLKERGALRFSVDRPG